MFFDSNKSLKSKLSNRKPYDIVVKIFCNGFYCVINDKNNHKKDNE